MPAPTPTRALADRSVRELVDHRSYVGHELAVHIYYLPEESFIVAPIDGTAPHVEVREVTVLPDGCSDEDIGRAMCDNLLWHQRHAPTNLQKRSLSDWPAFAASGYKTARKFQERCIFVTIGTMNSGLTIAARPYRIYNSGDRYVGVGCSIHQDHETFGASIRSALRGVDLLAQADYY